MLKKRIIAAILCLACVAFSGCGNNAGSSQSESTQSGSAQSSFTEKSQIEPSKEVSQVSETAESSKEESQVSENSKTSPNTNSSDADSSNATSSKTESSKPESSKASEASKTNQSSQNGKTEESSKSSQTSKPAENSQNSQASQTPNSGQTSQTSKPAETSKPSQVSKPESSKPAQASKPVEPSKPSQTSTPSQPSKPAVISVNSISLDKNNITLTVGESSKLTAAISPSNATNKNFSWVNSNTGVVSIDGSGNVKALKAGSATITAKSNNGKTAACNITVKNKVQPAKKKVTYFSLNNNVICVYANETTCSMLCVIQPPNMDLSDLRVTFTENPNNLVSLKRIERLEDSDQTTTCRLHFDVKPRNKDYIAQATVSCGGFSEPLKFRIQSKYDASLKAYYPPYDIDQIVKDMREYGESLGMEWRDDYYVKWYDNFSRYDYKGSFFFPVSTNVNNGISGIDLKDALFGSIRRPCETLGGPYSSFYFKVMPILNTRVNEWEFYVLYG